MPRYIDAEKLEQRLRDFSDWCRDNRKDGADFVLNGVLADTPTADVQEVKHGRWAHLGGDEWCCTCCGFVITTEGAWEEPAEKYCSYCGAKMGGEHEQTT